MPSWSSLSSERSVRRGKTGRWLWLSIRGAFLLFVAGVAALLWISHEADREEQRATLISDMLWLEQNLRFQLVRNEELLGQIHLQQVLSPSKYESHARALLTNSSGLRQILWLNAEGSMLRAAPSARSEYLVGEEQGIVPSPSLSRLVRSLGRPAYSAAYPIIGGDWQFEVHVPVIEGETTVGVVVGIYSMQKIIEESVPWWLSERYLIAVNDNAGKQLVSRSKITPTESGASYELDFDPPGHGLLLSATPYQTPLPVANRLVAVALVLLAVTVLVSLWMLRRYVQHRARAEDALREEYAFRQAMDDSMQTGLRACDLTGRIIYVNSAFCQMVGWSPEELVGCLPPMPYWTEETTGDAHIIDKPGTIDNASNDAFEQLLRRRSGEQFTALVHEAPLIDSSGTHTGWMSSVIDISDRKRQEERDAKQQERLQSTARLVAMGEMASGLAHELNQPLAAVSSYCSAALNMLGNKESPEHITAPLQKAVEQAQRAGQIVRRMYRLAQRSEGRLEAVCLTERVDAVVTLVESDLRRRGLSVHRVFAANPWVEGDAVLIEQALLNLIRNAGEAVSGTAFSPDPLSGQITVCVEEEGNYALLKVIDRGDGISPAAQEKLFDPLFTTKSEGMGMGLSICRSIAEFHKGRIYVAPNPKGGSIFTMSIPIIAQ